MPRSPTAPLRSQLVPMILARMASRGVDPAPLRARFRLPPDAAALPHVVLELRDFYALCTEAERALGDPHLGLNLALESPRGAYGVLEFSARHAATVRDALDRVTRYWRLLNDLVRVTLEPGARGELALVHRVPGEPLAVGRHSNEFTIAAMLRLCREAAHVPIVPRRAWFAHPAPDASLRAPLENYLGTANLAFGCGSNGLVLDREALTLPVVDADVQLLPVLDRYAASLLPAAPPEADLLARLRALIERSLEHGPPALDTAAAQLHMSERTLQRRLGESGVGFQQLVEETRRELALRYLADPTIAAGKIAPRLGYADPRTFLRAFRRWTGTTPRAYRARIG